MPGEHAGTVADLDNPAAPTKLTFKIVSIALPTKRNLPWPFTVQRAASRTYEYLGRFAVRNHCSRY